MCLGAEDGVDGRTSSGNRWRYSSGKRCFAGVLAKLTFDPKQFLKQNGAPRLGPAEQEVLDSGPVASPLPAGLETIGRLVDPGAVRGVEHAHANTPVQSSKTGDFINCRRFPSKP